MKDIWVFVELQNGIAAEVSLELILKAVSVADNRKVCAVILGRDISKVGNSLIYTGADHVFLLENEKLEFFDAHVYADVLIDLADKYKPDIFLFGATINGRSLAPLVATGLKTGLTADCTDLEIDRDTMLLKQTRPAFGGNLMAEIICPDKRPQMSTVRPGVFGYVRNREFIHKGRIINPEVKIPDSRVIVLERKEEKKGRPGICDASIVVSAGMGMGNKENLKLIREFADLIGAEIGASRAIVDARWIEREFQVGQSGNNINCDVYIACGISGAVQHMAGLKPFTTIIAINTDENAPIMKAANYSFVGDAAEILETYISRFKKLTGNN